MVARLRLPPADNARPPPIEEVADPVIANAPVASPPLNVEVEFVPVTLRKPAIVEVAVVEVAVKMLARTPVEPATARDVYGEVVPMPTLPVV